MKKLTKNLILLGVLKAGEIGVDVEIINQDRDYKKLISRYFSEAEKNKLKFTSDKDRLKTFYTFWTIKESVIKCVGTGFNTPFNTFSVDISNDETLKVKIESKDIYYRSVFIPSKSEIKIAIASDRPFSGENIMMFDFLVS